MAKSGKPSAQNTDPDRDMKLAVVGAAFFAVRLFKNPTESDEERGNMAVQASRDAKALLDAIDRLE